MKIKNPLLMAFCLVLTSQTLFGQLNFLWQQNYQHTSSFNFSNEGRLAVTDNDGNSYVLADATSDLDINGNPSTSTVHYVVLIKYDSLGTLISQKTIDIADHYTTGFKTYSAFGLEIDASGNIFIGYSLFEPSNDLDVYIRKYNPNLVPDWEFVYKPSSKDVGLDMIIASNGEVYALVASYSGVNVTNCIISASGTGAASSPLYSFTQDIEFPGKIIADSNNDLYVTGYTLVSGVKNIYTASLTSSGIQRWEIVYNGGSVARDDFGTDLAVDNNGHLFVTGTSDRGMPRMNDAFVMKHFDQTGKVFWITYHDYNNQFEDGAFINASASVTAGGFVVMCSATDDRVLIDRISINTGLSAGQGNYEPIPLTPYNPFDNLHVTDFITTPANKFYITGNVLTTESGSGSSFQAAFLVRFELVAAARGNQAFRQSFAMPVEGSAAESYDAADIHADYIREDIFWLRNSFITFSTHQRETILLMNLEGPSPLRNLNTSTENVTVYPNPFTDVLNFESSEQVSQIAVYDITGKLLFIQNNNNAFGLITTNVAGLPVGLYTVKITSNSGAVYTKKLNKI